MITGKLLADNQITLSGAPAGSTWVRSLSDSRDAVPAYGLVGRVNVNVIVDELQNGELYIKSVDYVRQVPVSGNLTQSLVQPPITGTVNAFDVNDKNLLHGRVTPFDNDSMVVKVYRTVGAGVVYPGGDGAYDLYDLTASIPSTSDKRRVVQLYRDPSTNGISAADGDETDLMPAQLTDSDAVAIAIPAGAERLDAVVLSNGQTVIDGTTKIIPARRLLVPDGFFVSSAAANLTISSGAVTVPANVSFLKLAAESGTSDDLTTVTVTGMPRIILFQADAGDTIAMKNAADNVHLNGGADFSLSSEKTIALFWDGTNLSDVGASTTSGSVSNPLAADLNAGAYDITNVDRLEVNEVAAPGTPSSGKFSIYAKSDGKVYGKNDGGTEYDLTLGGGGALLASSTLGSAQASISITSISGSYKTLKLICNLRGDTAATEVELYVRLNNNSTAGDYYLQRFGATNTGTAAAQAIGATATVVASPMPAASATANLFGSLELTIPNYAASVIHVCQWQSSWFNALSSGNLNIRFGAGALNSAAAITRIDLLMASGNIDTGSTYELYGLG